MRSTDVARVALGAGLVARPDLPLRWWGPPDATSSDVPAGAVRVLGARLLAQGIAGPALGRALPSRRRAVVLAGAAVEVAHAASMVPLGVGRPRWRRVASVSGAVALALALGDLVSRG